MIQPPLLSLLGASWSLGSRATAVAWADGGAAAGFALADGSVALARSSWPGAPGVRARPGGGVELVPATAPAPPVVRAIVHEGACLALAAAGDRMGPRLAGGFLAGGADGRLASVTADGTPGTVATFEGEPVVAVASVRAGWVCAVGRRLRAGPAPAAVELPATATAMAVRRAGPAGAAAEVAVLHAGGATLWSEGRAPVPLARASAEREGEGRGALAWSPDGGRHLTDGARLWRPAEGGAWALAAGAGEPGSFAFTHDGQALITVGTAGPLAWTLGAAPAAEPCGVAGEERQAAVRVACHPRRALVAFGYANGAILLGRPGGADLLFVKAAGGGAVAQLSFSHDGGLLAFGTVDGDAGLIMLPAPLFRSGDPADTQGADR